MPSGVLLNAFNLKPAQAIAYLKGKGNRYTWNWYDQWQEAHAKSFTVAKAMSADVLQTIRGEVTRALDEGRTLAQFKKDLMPRLKTLGWWGKDLDKDGREVQLGSPYRLRTVYQANLQSAYQSGHYQRNMEVAQDLPWWRYVAINDSKTRPAHRALNGKVFRYDDPVWDHIHPPNGFGCRCTVVAMTERQLQRAGITPEDSSGKIETKRVVLKGSDGEPRDITVHGYRTTTGDGQPITFWTDPGWDYNPGKAAWQPELDKYSPDVARQYIEGVVTGPDFARFIDAGGEQEGRHPVAVLDSEYRKLIGARSQTVWLSSDSLRKNIAHHPELVLADYQALPDIVQNADVIVKVGDLREVFVRRRGAFYRAAVKATRDGQELYLLSLHQVNERTIRQVMQSGEVLRARM